MCRSFQLLKLPGLQTCLFATVADAIGGFSVFRDGRPLSVLIQDIYFYFLRWTSNMTTKQSRFTFTSESVSEGHPDKVCDLIADSILDAYVEQDQQSHVACEVLCKEDTVVLAGEITSGGKVDHERIARQAIHEIGYIEPNEPFNAERSEEHTSELQSRLHLVCRLLLEKKKRDYR